MKYVIGFYFIFFCLLFFFTCQVYRITKKQKQEKYFTHRNDSLKIK